MRRIEPKQFCPTPPPKNADGFFWNVCRYALPNATSWVFQPNHGQKTIVMAFFLWPRVQLHIADVVRTPMARSVVALDGMSPYAVYALFSHFC